MDYFKSYNFDIKKNERLINVFKRLSVEKEWKKDIKFSSHNLYDFFDDNK